MARVITLEDDAALVIFELLASEKLDLLVDTAERNAFWLLEASLDKTLVEPFLPDYLQLLEQARQSLILRTGTESD